MTLQDSRTMRCTEVADRPLPDGKFNCRDIGDRGRSAMVVITLCDPATVSHSKKFHGNMRVIVATCHIRRNDCPSDLWIQGEPDCPCRYGR